MNSRDKFTHILHPYFTGTDAIHSMDKQSLAWLSVGWNYLSIPKLQV